METTCISKTKALQYTQNKKTFWNLCILLQLVDNWSDTHNNPVQAQSSRIVINSLNVTIEIHSTDFCFSGFKPPSSRSCDHEYYNSLEDLAKWVATGTSDCCSIKQVLSVWHVKKKVYIYQYTLNMLTVLGMQAVA